MKLLQFRMPVSKETAEHNQFFAWPVKAVPIRFWGKRVESLDILEFAVLGLAQSGVLSEERIRELLGLPEHSQELLDKTISRLKTLHFLDGAGRITPTGQDCYLEDAQYFDDYRTGYLFYDLVQGGFLGYVHEGKLPEGKKDDAVAVNPKTRLPDEMHLTHLAYQAIRNYQRIVSEDWYDQGDEADKRVERVEDDEIAQLDFGRRHSIGEAAVTVENLDAHYDYHLLIEVRGGIYQQGEGYYSLSPFSPMKTDSYLNTLRKLEQEEVQNALRDLRERVNQEPILEEQLKQIEDERTRMLRLLDERCAYLDERDFSDTLKLQIRRSENEHLTTLTYLSEQVTNRKNAILAWAQLIELVLNSYLCQCERLSLVGINHQLDRALRQTDSWLTRELENGRWSFAWRDIPEEVYSRMKKLLWEIGNKKLRIVGQFWVKGIVDILAVILLSTLIVSSGNLPTDVVRMMDALNRDKQLLDDIIQVAKLRNQKGAHSNLDIYNLDESAYTAMLEEVRQRTLKVMDALGEVPINDEGMVIHGGQR